MNSFILHIQKISGTFAKTFLHGLVKSRNTSMFGNERTLYTKHQCHSSIRSGNGTISQYIPLYEAANINDEEGIDNYAALIVRKDNTNFINIVSEFNQTVNLFRTKPDTLI